MNCRLSFIVREISCRLTNSFGPSPFSSLCTSGRLVQLSDDLSVGHNHGNRFHIGGGVCAVTVGLSSAKCVRLHLRCCLHPNCLCSPFVFGRLFVRVRSRRSVVLSTSGLITVLDPTSVSKHTRPQSAY
jgi:hypothetical protein